MPSIAQVEETRTVDTAKNHEISDGGYGWVCVGCMLMIAVFTWAINGLSAHPSNRLTIANSMAH